MAEGHNQPRMTAFPYTYAIAEGSVQNHTAVNKFGHNSTVGAALEPVWDYSTAYDYLGDAAFATMYISSDDELNDVGLTFSVSGIDSDFNASTVTVTTHAVDARTGVALTSGAADDKWWRIFRVINTSATDMTGTVYVSKADAGADGIPDADADCQAMVMTANQQTLMAQWTCPAGYTAYITSYYAATATAKVTEIHLLVRPFGGVFNIKHVVMLNAGYASHKFDFPVPVAAKSDIVIRAATTGAGGDVSAGFDLWYES